MLSIGASYRDIFAPRMPLHWEPLGSPRLVPRQSIANGGLHERPSTGHGFAGLMYS
jgi:hypothetical protein